MQKYNNTNPLYISMKRMLMFAFAILLVINLCEAISTLPPVQQGHCVNLPQSEFGSSYENISGIQLPNKTIVSPNVAMVKSNNLYSYSFCNTNLLGTYVVNGYSDLSVWAYTFDVTASGQGDLASSSLPLVVILIVFATLFLVIGYSIAPDKWLLKSALYFTSLMIMIINIGLGIQLAPSANVNTLMTTAMIIGIAAFSIFAMYMFVAYMVNVIRGIKHAKELKKEEGLL